MQHVGMFGRKHQPRFSCKMVIIAGRESHAVGDYAQQIFRVLGMSVHVERAARAYYGYGAIAFIKTTLYMQRSPWVFTFVLGAAKSIFSWLSLSRAIHFA